MMLFELSRLLLLVPSARRTVLVKTILNAACPHHRTDNNDNDDDDDHHVRIAERQLRQLLERHRHTQPPKLLKTPEGKHLVDLLMTKWPRDEDAVQILLLLCETPASCLSVVQQTDLPIHLQRWLARNQRPEQVRTCVDRMLSHHLAGQLQLTSLQRQILAELKQELDLDHQRQCEDQKRAIEQPSRDSMDEDAKQHDPESQPVDWDHDLPPRHPRSSNDSNPELSGKNRSERTGQDVKKLEKKPSFGTKITQLIMKRLLHKIVHTKRETNKKNIIKAENKLYGLLQRNPAIALQLIKDKDAPAFILTLTNHWPDRSVVQIAYLLCENQETCQELVTNTGFLVFLWDAVEKDSSRIAASKCVDLIQQHELRESVHSQVRSLVGRCVAMSQSQMHGTMSLDERARRPDRQEEAHKTDVPAVLPAVKKPPAQQHLQSGIDGDNAGAPAQQDDRMASNAEPFQVAESGTSSEASTITEENRQKCIADKEEEEKQQPEQELVDASLCHSEENDRDVQTVAIHDEEEEHDSADTNNHELQSDDQRCVADDEDERIEPQKGFVGERVACPYVSEEDYRDVHTVAIECGEQGDTNNHELRSYDQNPAELEEAEPEPSQFSRALEISFESLPVSEDGSMDINGREYVVNPDGQSNGRNKFMKGSTTGFFAKPVMIKVYQKKRNARGLNELEKLGVMTRMPEFVQFIVNPIDATADDQAIMLVLPLGHENLLQIVATSTRRTRRDEVLPAMKKIAECLRFLHSDAKLVHGDLNLENVVDFGDNEADFRLIDFENCRRIDDEMVKECTCSAEYCPPELAVQLVNAKTDQSPSLRASGSFDVWCFGVLWMKYLQQGRTLAEFEDLNDPKGILHRICDADFDFEQTLEQMNWISSDMKALIRECTAKDPLCRPTIQDILENPSLRSQINATATPETPPKSTTLGGSRKRTRLTKIPETDSVEVFR